MKCVFRRVLLLSLKLCLPAISLSQNDNTTFYPCVMNSVTALDSHIVEAMDSCIAIVSECQFYKDGIESIVIVRPLKTKDDYVNSLEFQVSTKNWGDMETLLDFCNSLHMPTPSYYKYRNLGFVFFLPFWGEQLKVSNNYDTVYFPISTIFYKYIRDLDKRYSYSRTIPPAKIAENIAGFVYLYRETKGNWLIKTIKCIDVSPFNIIFDNGEIRVYSIQ